MNDLQKTLIIIALIGLFTFKPRVLNAPGNLPRGIRNNNPGNIRRGNSAWVGKVPFNQSTDNEFEQFQEMKYGIRAALKLLSNYMSNYQLKTISQILNKWAPTSENDTQEYINFVSTNTGIPQNQPLQIQQLPYIAYEMFIVENGGEYVTKNEILNAWYTV